MTDWKLPWEGSCLCGQVHFSVSAPPLMTMACHCRGCQRMSASAYSLTAAIPSTGFAVTQGEPVIGALHGIHRHYFCPHCLSWMFTRVHGVDLFVNIRATLLEDTSWFSPFIETYVSEKLPWAATPAVHTYEEFPPGEAYAGLMAEYASSR